jgi:hypothetical protein
MPYMESTNVFGSWWDKKRTTRLNTTRRYTIRQDTTQNGMPRHGIKLHITHDPARHDMKKI